MKFKVKRIRREQFGWAFEAKRLTRSGQLPHVPDLVRRHQARTHWAETVDALADEPLLVARLKVTQRDIVDDGVAEAVIKGGLLCDTAPPFPMTTASSTS